jgi:hypothetical protein
MAAFLDALSLVAGARADTVPFSATVSGEADIQLYPRDWCRSHLQRGGYSPSADCSTGTYSGFGYANLPASASASASGSLAGGLLNIDLATTRRDGGAGATVKLLDTLTFAGVAETTADGEIQMNASTTSTGDSDEAGAKLAHLH